MTDFFVLTWYPVTLLNSFILIGIFVESLWFSTYKSLSVNRYFYFFIYMSCISLSCLITLARISSTMLNRSGKSKHPCLVPDLRGNTFSSLPLSMMPAVGFSYMACIMFISKLVKCFYNERLLNLVKCIYASIEMIM